MEAAQRREFVERYIGCLAELTFNSKPQINSLTTLASENGAAASSVAAAIERHIQSCPPQCKLPALYLVDSITKNLREPFTSLFARNLPQTYAAVWDSLPSSRQALHKLFLTWTGVFPPPVLAAIQRSQQLPGPNGGHDHQQQQQLYAPSMAAQQYPPAAQPAPSYQLPAYQQQQQQQQYGQPEGFFQQQQPVMYSQQQQQAPVYTQSQPLYLQPGMPYAQQEQQHPAPVYLQEPAYAQMQQQQPPMQHQPMQQAPGYADYSAPAQPAEGASAVPLQHDQLAALLQALQGAASQPQQVQQEAFAPQQQHSASPALGQGLGAEPAQQQPAASAAPVDLADSAAAKAYLQADCGGIVSELMASTDALRKGFMEQAVAKRQRLERRARPSQTWFFDADTWLSGTGTSGETAPVFFEEEQDGERAVPEMHSEPADESQPSCAISGERFASFWHTASESWHFENAKRIFGDEAARYGVPSGSLVKVSCLRPQGTPEPEPFGNPQGGQQPLLKVDAAADPDLAPEPGVQPEVTEPVQVKAEADQEAAPSISDAGAGQAGTEPSANGLVPHASVTGADDLNMLHAAQQVGLHEGLRSTSDQLEIAATSKRAAPHELEALEAAKRVKVEPV